MPLAAPPRCRLLPTPWPGIACGAAMLAMLVGSGCSNTVKFANTTGPTPSAVKNGPQLGYAWKPQDQTLRPILGVPGSSLIGASVVSATTYVAGAASPVTSIALLIGSDQQLYRMSLPGGIPAKLNLTASAGAIIRFSPSGTAAAVFVPGSTAASVVTNLTASLQTRQLSASTPLLDLAISDAGSVAALLKAGSSCALDLFPASGAAQPLATLGAPGGLTFIGTGDNLLAGDSASNTLTLIRTASTAPSASQIPTAGLLASPVAVGASRNGKWAVVANGADPSVVQIDLTGAAAPQRIACPLQPSAAEQLAGNGVFRFTSIGSQPSWIADITDPTPTMLFIPASK